MDTQPSMDDQFLALINRIIEDNLADEHFSVEDLSEKAGLSRSMLHRKLIKLTGKSATDIITEIRLNRAKEMLENKVATVSEIAYRVGFNSPSYFHKVFKKHFRVSPGDVKKGTPISAKPLSYLPGKDKKQLIVARKIKIRRSILITVLAILISGAGIYIVLSKIKSEEKSIAVLPLENLTGQPDNAYFVDGMHDALIGELGQISSLRVISRTSTIRYRNSNMLLKDIANELGVNTIVEGSIQCVGDSLCFLIQMIDVFPKERHLLSNEYYDKMQNVLFVQSSAVQDIANEIRTKLTHTEEEHLAKSRQVNPETYKAYLRGMYYLNQGTNEGFEKGIKCFQEAIDKDPGDPFAYASLALGYAIMGHGVLTPQESFLRATSAANKALKLDPNNDEAYTALALLYLYQKWNYPKAKEAFENAIAKNPSNEIAHAHYAWYHVLYNDIDKAIYHGNQAVLLEPFSASYNSWLALLYWSREDLEKAEYWANKSLELKKNTNYGYLALSWISLERKEYEKALEYAEKLPENNTYWMMLRGYVYLKTGHREKALQYWNNLAEPLKERRINTGNMGIMAAYLGFTDLAFELLNDAIEKKHYPASYITFYPGTENIKEDPRYNDLLRKMNLPIQSELISSNQ